MPQTRSIAMKLFAYVATVACAVLRVQAQEEASPEGAQCAAIDFTTKTADFVGLNNVVDIASGMIKDLAKPFDPLHVKDKVLDVVPFDVAGLHFQLTPTIQTLQVAGITTLKPRHLNVSSPSSLEIGADFLGNLKLDATLRLSIQQVNRRWWDLCWTNPLKPKECPPKEIDIDVSLGLAKPSLATNVLVAMLQCPANAKDCKDLTVMDLMMAGLNMKTDPTAMVKFASRVLLRIKEVQLLEVAINFDQVTDLGFHFHSSGPLVTELGKKLLAFGKDELNKKGDIYNLAMQQLQKQFVTLGNKVIAQKLAPQFGSDCHDNSLPTSPFSHALPSAQEEATEATPEIVPFVSEAEAKGQCSALDFTQKAGDFTGVNNIIDIAVNSGLLKAKLAALDPLSIKDKTLDAIPFDIVGLHFQITPTIQTLQATGVSSVKPRHLEVTSPSSLQIGADFEGDVKLDTTVRLSIQQVNRRWWDLCWTNLLKPKDCPPAIIDLDASLGLSKPSVGTNALIAMLQCPPNAGADCKDITMFDLMMAGMSGDPAALTAFLNRVLLRIKEVQLLDLSVNFDKVTDLNLHFHSSGPLVTELGKKLYAFAKDEMNKKGDIFKFAIGQINKQGKKLANKVIAEKFGSKFGGDCRDK
ncbi:TPA: LOW QUALITY PROTEIN: hypothetical protein N0F65_009479 [Lagenidium giganteum]|uniref:Lipid-binding serum glycoprotein C-terminal domain-containing protein n=1 Tax=Lagenidium giganteum TaxID=4803 RepID=A0AAV2ZH73_9STRA|nr:TPA: LOW QUALITY PROTEIN: hypothetical protein N0F65_009479 [Lagenidium giganteum]